MNIFYLDHNPRVAASFHGDKHVVKMCIETAQMLCTAHHLLNKDNVKTGLYKATHINHPCNIWIRENSANYNWAFTLFESLCYEFYIRRNKIHASQKLLSILAEPPDIIKFSNIRSMPALAMPEQFKTRSPVVSYRNYYASKHEEGIVTYNWSQKRKEPWWLKNG